MDLYQLTQNSPRAPHFAGFSLYRKSSLILRASWSYRTIRLGDLLLCRASRARERHGAQRSITNTFVTGVEPTSAVKKLAYIASLLELPDDSTRRFAALPSEPCERTPRSAAKYYEYFRKQRGANFGRKKSSPVLRASWSYWPDSNRRPADYESAALPAEPQ